MEERQILLLYPPLIEGQNESPSLGLQEEVGVFDAFSDSLERQGRAEAEAAQQRIEVCFGNVRVDGHGWIFVRRPRTREIRPARFRSERGEV